MGTKQKIKLNRFQWHTVLMALAIAEKNSASLPFKKTYSTLRTEIREKWKEKKKVLLE